MTAPAPGAPETPSFGARAVVQMPAPTSNDEDPSASGTRIDLTGRAAAPHTLSDLLMEAPGVSVQHSGGAGSFASLALRASEADHAEVLLDTLPLTSPDGGAFDLSLIPTALLEAVEVYRGGAPTWLNSGSIGGALRLLPRRPTGSNIRAMLGHGSFREIAASLAAEARIGSTHGLAHLQLQSAANDFSFLQTQGTELGPDGSAQDDLLQPRANADLLRGNGMLHLERPLGPGEISLVSLGVVQEGGLPGPAVQPTPGARQGQLQVIHSLRYGSAGTASPVAPLQRWELVLLDARQWQRIEDSAVERFSDDRRDRQGLRLATVLRPARHSLVTGTLSLGREAAELGGDALYQGSPDSWRRYSAGVALEPALEGNLAGRSWSLRPSALLRWYSAPDAPGSDSEALWLPTYRLGSHLHVMEDLLISASVASGGRAPSMLELLGDRRSLLPGRDLAPERAWNADLGSVARLTLGALRGQLELRLFGVWFEDLIRYLRNAQYSARPDNIDAGHALGIEAGLDLLFGHHARLRAAGTWMHTRNDLNQALTYRPELQGQLRPSLQFGPLGPIDTWVTFMDLRHVGLTTFSDDGRVQRPPRTRVTLGTALYFLKRRWCLRGEGRNLTETDSEPNDLDWAGYPLPGRAFHVSIAYEHRP